MELTKLRAKSFWNPNFQVPARSVVQIVASLSYHSYLTFRNHSVTMLNTLDSKKNEFRTRITLTVHSFHNPSPNLKPRHFKAIFDEVNHKPSCLGKLLHQILRGLVMRQLGLSWYPQMDRLFHGKSQTKMDDDDDWV